MSPVHPSRPSREDPKARPVLLRDQACPGCGYNLKGLKSGGTCPECGRTILAVDIRMGDALSDSPLSYMRELGSGGWLLALAYPVLMLAGIAGLVLVPSRASPWIMIASGVLLAGAGSLWLLGVFIVTRPRRSRVKLHEDEGLWFRNGARLTQASWIVAGLVVSSRGAFAGAPAEPFVWATWVFALAAYFGMALLMIHISVLCEWASDTGLAGWFRTIAWIIGALGGFLTLGWVLGVIYTATSSGILAPFMGLVALGTSISWLGVGLGAIVQILLHLSFVRMVRWSVKAAIARKEKDARTARRAERLARQGEAERAVNAPPPPRPGPIDIAPPGAEVDAPVKPQGKVIERPAGGAPEYDIEG